MTPDPLSATLAFYNDAISRLPHVRCVSAWKGAGSTVFLEYGLPTIRRVTRKRYSTTVVRGEGAVGVYADDWTLSIGKSRVLTSETVDAGSLSQVSDTYFCGSHLPVLELTSEIGLTLQFSSGPTLRIRPNSYDVGDALEDELVVTVPGARCHFNFRRGLYEISDTMA